MNNPSETMLRLMSIPTSQFDGVCRTSDGYYIAQRKGDIGYNHFLGRPSPPHDGPGRDQMLKVWGALTKEEKVEVLALAASPIDGSPILLHKDFGVPVDAKEEDGYEIKSHTQPWTVLPLQQLGKRG